MTSRRPNEIVRSALSFLQRQVLERRRTPFNPVLSVVEVDGERRLDGMTVNYSRGSLQRVLAAALREMKPKERRVERVLMLGFGAGSAVAVLREEHGLDPFVVAVDVDPEVFELARKWFEFADDARVRFVVADAAEHVRTDRELYDLVIVDAFVDDAIPASLRTKSFADAAKERVDDGGALLFNTMADDRASRAASDEVGKALEDGERIEGALRALEIETNRVWAWERAPRRDGAFTSS